MSQDPDKSASAFPLNDKKVINGWAFFDWANSAYALVITVAIFPIYFNEVIDDRVRFLGMEMENSAVFSYSLSIAYIIIAIILPLLTGIADYGGRKMAFMRFFTRLGGLACISLFFFEDEWFFTQAPLFLGVVGFILATIGFAGGLVFYNSYLPEIVTEDRFDRVSARGYAYGYIGSVLLLIINLVIITYPQWFGITSLSFATRLAFIMVGLWWIGFSQITFRRLPKDQGGPLTREALRKGYEELQKVFQNVKRQGNINRFLMAFFCYSAGVQTVLFLASTFATVELQYDTTELILIILILQLVAIAGAFLFARVSDWKGNKFSLIVMLLIWMVVCVMAYYVQSKSLFYLVAVMIGMVMGGIQSLSRSTYSKLLPEQTKDTASYFSFYDVLEKLAVVLGTFSFGFINNLTGNMRVSVLTLTLFFIISLIALSTIQVKPAASNNAA